MQQIQIVAYGKLKERYLRDACAEYDRKILILDRPNPNGHYVDGPILDMKYKSGVALRSTTSSKSLPPVFSAS